MLQLKIATLTIILFVFTALLIKYGPFVVILYSWAYGSIVFLVYVASIAILDILDNLKR